MTKKTDIKQSEDKIASLEDQLKRAVADYHNLEKRVTEGRSELTAWGNQALIHKLLPVLDHLEKVVELGRPVLSERSESKDWFKGVEISVKQFKDVLKSEGLEEVSCEGQFDPSCHEAIDIRSGEDNMILENTQKGYTLNGRIFRPAKVVVGKSSLAKASEDEKGDS